MKRAPQQVHIGYFGKIPTRADFVKAADNVALAGLLDQWLAEVMNRLTVDPRWKQHYDGLRPLHFAFVGTRSRHAVAGHLIASSDQSQRRYPFMQFSTIDIDAPRSFLPECPLVLAPLWQTMTVLAADVLAAGDPAQALHTLALFSLELDPAAPLHHAASHAFLGECTLDRLAGLLGCASASQIVLALGLLLQPVRRSGEACLEKSLALPLPRGADEGFAVAAFWLALMLPFLQQADFELALFFTEVNARPALVIGFGGAAPETLQAIVDPYCAGEFQINFDDTSWVEDMLNSDPALQTLAACMAQGGLSLGAVLPLFHHAFA
ncbi:type VI secretion system-associated protein TagF [Oxalobacteraceae bacterium]|nr:type VI secretion system-associated protein TagF [Oxalobacteraceae bacterium]